MSAKPHYDTCRIEQSYDHLHYIQNNYAKNSSNDKYITK